MKVSRIPIIPAIVLALLVLPYWSSSAMQSKKTIKLTLQVKGPDGNPVGGARVYVWHDTWVPDIRPADYREETHANGQVTLEVRAGETSEVTIEVSKDDLQWTGNIKLSGTTIYRSIEIKKVSSDDDSKLIKVKVHVEGEKQEPIPGARIVFSDIGGSRRSEADGYTDQNGDATLGVRAYTYAIHAGKDGYQSGEVRISLNKFQSGKTITAPTIKLTKKTVVETNVEVVVQVQNAKDLSNVVGAEVVLTGQAGVTSGIYKGTTDGSGTARITLKAYGKFSLEISQEYFETLSSDVQIAQGEGEKNLPPYRLKEKSKKSEGNNLVSVKVLASDKNQAPIVGGTVSVEKISTATDATGLAMIRDVIGIDATSVIITATAQGYKRQTKIAQVRRDYQYTDATASATFVMEPGEDPPSEDTPIRLVVEIIDSFTQQPLSNTDVRIRFKGKLVGIENTNEFGEARFELKDSAPYSVAEFRSGLKVDAYHDNYIPRDSDITPDLLMPSSTPRIVTLHLERDWTALGKDLTVLEGKVAAWDKDAKEAATLPGQVQSRVGQLKLINQRVGATVTELNNFRRQVTGFNGPGDQLRCANAAQLKSNLERYEVEANRKAQEVAEKLKLATALAERCSAVTDGATIKRHYQDAIRLAAEIGRLDKLAGEDSRKLAILAKEVEAVRQTLKEAQDLIPRIDVEARTAEVIAKQIRADYDRGTALSKDLDKRRDALAQAINDLKKLHGLDPRFINRLPLNLKKRFDDLAELVASRNSDLFSSPNITSVEDALRLLESIRKAKAEAEKNLAEYNNALCNIDPMNERVRAINQALLDASAELGLAADLPRKADECTRQGACMPALANIRSLLEEDNLESAEAEINKARINGCDVSKATEELEYFRTVRRTANLLAESLENCRFQQALNLAQQIPASIKSRPLVAQALSAVQRGLQAQRRIAQLRASAKLAVERTRQMTSANSYIEEAEMAAEGFPCLMEEVARFRDEYEPRDSATKPQVEELPEDADHPTTRPTGKAKSKPKVEEIPDDDKPNQTDNRPPAQKPAVTTPPGGSLQLANPQVKDAYAHVCCGGRTDYTYGLNSATLKYAYPPSEGGNVTVEWQFDGVPPGAISPGEEITITVTGNFSASLPDRDFQPPAAGGVRVEGDVEMIEQKTGYVGRNFKQIGKYIFRVRPNAKWVSIGLGADYGLGTFVVYRYGTQPK
ncbi:MAG: hypothetical protein AB1757_24430 [Acidobacteriota bacterium]